MKIAAVRCFQVTGRGATPQAEERQVGMLDIHPEFAARAVRPGAALGPVEGVYVTIETDEGITGLFGPIFAETAPLIRNKLAPYLLGRDPLATEHLWDLMYRQDRHARAGYEMLAISAVDNALWDIRGKALGVPVYRLLGGPTRDRVPCYASMLGHSLDEGLVRERAQWAVAQGYNAQKWFFRYGPHDGLAGMERNVALARTVREAVGSEIEIMFDAWMGWDAPYTVRMLERIAAYQPRWMEEPVPPDRVDDFVHIRRRSNVPLATGEHEYTRWGFLHLLQADAVDVIQADPDWCGGISELTKICTLASAYGRQVVPHGHSIAAAVHVIAATPPATCPMAEYLVRHQPGKQFFHETRFEPVNGAIALPTAPGLGIAIDDATVEARIEIG